MARGTSILARVPQSWDNPLWKRPGDQSLGYTPRKGYWGTSLEKTWDQWLEVLGDGDGVPPMLRDRHLVKM